MKISVFVDGANFFFMQKDLGWFVDLKKLLEYIARKGQIVDASYYVGMDIVPEVKQQGFLDALPFMGFSVVTKPIKTIYDPVSGTQKKKANLDIEIVLDMFNTIDNYDMAVLVSGDGDFERVLQLLKVRGKQFFVIATDKFMARELRNVAGRHYISLEEIRQEIAK